MPMHPQSPHLLKTLGILLLFAGLLLPAATMLAGLSVAYAGLGVLLSVAGIATLLRARRAGTPPAHRS
jgi:hypothetical protein